MAEANEEVYQGREGTGSAQVFRESISPFVAFAGQQQNRAQALGIQRMRYAQQIQQKRDDDVNKISSENLGHPGWLNTVNRVNKISQYRDGIQKLAYDNPHLNPNEIGIIAAKDRAKIKQDEAKYGQIEYEADQAKKIAENPNNNIDKDFITKNIAKLYDVDDPHQVKQGGIISMTQTPRAYDASGALAKEINDTKSKFTTNDPTVISDYEGYGVRLDKRTNSVRFDTDDNGNIKNSVVDHFVAQDKRMADRLAWEFAKKQAHGSSFDDAYATPEEWNAIQQRYDMNSKDPVGSGMQGYVRGEVRKALNAHQQEDTKYFTQIHNKPASLLGQPSEQDKNNRLTRVRTISNAFDNDPNQQTPSSKANEYLSELKGVAKFGGMPVTEVKFVPAEIRTKGLGGGISKPAQLHIQVKSGIDGGEVQTHDFYINMTNKKEVQKIINNMYSSTRPTTGEGKITGENLEAENNNIFGLDEDEKF